MSDDADVFCAVCERWLGLWAVGKSVLFNAPQERPAIVCSMGCLIEYQGRNP